MDGGYKHGEVRFSLPPQCSLGAVAVVDEALLAALDSANAAHCSTIKRLRYSLPFVGLANTDDDLMTETAEAILMGSAFEQLLRGDGRAYKLSKRFGRLFEPFGRVTVAEARRVRPGIELDQSVSDRAAAQPKWWVHCKWIEELYDVRSKSVHQDAASSRTWGWSPAEHLVMAAWVFPLVVKVLLQQDGHYNLTDTDKARCLAVDTLLATISWAGDTGTGSKWYHIVSETRRGYVLEELFSHLLDEEPSGHTTEGSSDTTTG